jgi:ABC-type Fe3+ transport system permease subunit
MKLIAFTVFTVVGLAAGMVIGLSTMPGLPTDAYRSDRYWHLIVNTLGGAAAGMGIAAACVHLTDDKSKKG